MPPQKPLPISSEGLGPEGLNAYAPTLHDEFLNRVVNTPYQNLTGKTMQVTVLVDLEIVNNQLARADLNVAVISGGNAFGSFNSIQSDNVALGTFHVSATLSFIIPPNYFYELDDSSAGGTMMIAQWYEIY